MLAGRSWARQKNPQSRQEGQGQGVATADIVPGGDSSGETERQMWGSTNVRKKGHPTVQRAGGTCNINQKQYNHTSSAGKNVVQDRAAGRAERKADDGAHKITKFHRF